MGYSTEFVGELKFTSELTATQLAALKDLLGADVREHPEWGAANLYYIDLELKDDFSGVRWSGAEKTYGMVDAVNLITRLMRERWPAFGLTGTLDAQGEEFDDRWRLVIDDNGNARKEQVVMAGTKVECPECGHTFRHNDA